MSEDCEIAAMLEQHARSVERRAEVLPDVHACLRVMMDAYCRLKEIGWNDAIYCPKDGSTFKVIEFGSTGTFDCHYDGEWPTGRWWTHDAGDLWPSRPVMYLKPYPEHPLKQRAALSKLSQQQGSDATGSPHVRGQQNEGAERE